MPSETPEYRDALGLALKKLRLKDRFESEIRAELLAKGHTEQVADDVVSFLREKKLLNDKRTIENFIERKSGSRSVGIEKLRAELIMRGAPEEWVDECLAREAGADETARMVAALKSKFRPGDDRAKAARFLLGRGFAEDGLETALDTFFGSE